MSHSSTAQNAKEKREQRSKSKDTMIKIVESDAELLTDKYIDDQSKGFSN